MEARTLHLANHDDPAGDVGRDLSTRISHVSALLQQLALRGRFGGVSAGNSGSVDEDSSVERRSTEGPLCPACGSRPCHCDLATRGQLKDDYLSTSAPDQVPDADLDESHTGRLVAADDLQRDALNTWRHHEQQQWTDQLRADLAPSTALAEKILADPTADSAAALAAARVLVADTHLAADSARHGEAVAQAADRWHEWGAGDKWGQYLPADTDLAAATQQLRGEWTVASMRQLVPVLERGDAAASLATDHETLDAGVRSLATTWGVEKSEQGYRVGGQDLTGTGPAVAAANVEGDVDDSVADIAAYQQRAAGEDRDPATVPAPLGSAAIAKARQGRAASRFVDSDGDLKEAAAHEAVDVREPQPIRPIRNHLIDMPDPTPLPGRGGPTHRT
ncbi:MAG: hypothetical protein KA755_09695 [Candidatus Microthrix sp.]|nr:hypothetical protein [Candidatus Microthrix sp.]